MSVIDEIAAERKRQIEVEGWTPEHDDEKHDNGALCTAAAAYALNVGDQINPYSCGDNNNECPIFWPFEKEWWKPKNTRSDLIRAAALIVAEIERFDRNPI